MQIYELTLWTASVELQAGFYRDVLELPVEIADNKILIRAGATHLSFQEATHGWQGAYHFAFNVPKNHYGQARDWLAARAPLLKNNEGLTEFHSQTWNSDSVYFKDAAGNVLELIARNTLENAVEAQFTPQHLLNVSEVGIAAEDVRETVEYLKYRLGEPVYSGEGSDQFSAIGDENGLLIVVKRGRIWMPDSGVAADYLPMQLYARTNNQEKYKINAPPYPARIERWG
jgi:catechol-2,3-dioxygenase